LLFKTPVLGGAPLLSFGRIVNARFVVSQHPGRIGLTLCICGDKVDHDVVEVLVDRIALVVINSVGDSLDKIITLVEVCRSHAGQQS
jgi:hypothetical protein